MPSLLGSFRYDFKTIFWNDWWNDQKRIALHKTNRENADRLRWVLFFALHMVLSHLSSVHLEWEVAKAVHEVSIWTWQT